MTADEIRRLRLRKGWSRDQLAHALGVSYEKVAAWEDGERVDCPHALSQVLTEGELERASHRPVSARGERWSA